MLSIVEMYASSVGRYAAKVLRRTEPGYKQHKSWDPAKENWDTVAF